MPTPSIVIVPARLKAATLFSQLPLTGEADLSLVQASGNATRVNASGLIEIPRTNLHTHSEAFASNYTTVLNLTASGTNLTAPDNSATADRYFETTTNGAHVVAITGGGGFPITSGLVYTTSVFVKAIGGRNFRIIVTAGGASENVLYTLSGSGSVSIPSIAKIESYGNDWYRCSLTFTATSSVNFRQNLYSISGTTNDFPGDPSKGIILWGAQLQIGNTATTYIPTTSSIRTLFAGVAQDGALSPNIPRLDYRNLVGAVDCPALLVEPSATNLATRSNELSTIPNVVDASTTTGTPFISPDGTANAMRFTETTANDRHGFYQYNQSPLVAQAYTISVFTKQTGRRYIAFTSDYTGTGVSTYFDLQTATTVSVGSGWTARIEPYLDGWYRLSCTATAVSGVINSRYVIWGGSVSGTSNSYVGSTSISNTFYGLQVETGSVATSYIPTTTASATRGADNYSVSGAVSGFIGLSSGAIYAEVDVRNWEASGRVVALSDGTSDGSIVIMENANRSFSLVVNVAGSSEVNITTASGLYNGLHRIAIAYKKDDYAVYLNGQLAGTDTSAGVPSVNRIFVGKIESSGTTNYFNDRIRAIAFYNTRPTNSELATLTQVDYTNLVWDTYTSRTSLSTELPECLFVRHIELLNT